MSHLGIAAAMGVPAASVARLLNGEVTPHVSARVGTMSLSVQAFINGEVKPGMAQALGTNVGAAQELRTALDRKGAIGVVIGLAIAGGKRERAERGATAARTPARTGLNDDLLSG
jgi:hypothetical protein